MGDSMEVKQSSSKEIEFDIRKKPSGRVNGTFKDKEENLNRFSYGKGFEISGPSAITFDVYNMELTVPPEFVEIEGVLSIMLDGSKFLEVGTAKLMPGVNTLDIDQVVSKGHALSAVLDYTNAKNLGHYVLQLKLQNR